MRSVKLFVKCVLFGVAGLYTVLVMLGIGGYPSPFPDTEITQHEPFVKFVGREYRVKAPTYATFGNDFPDKEKILTVTIGPAYAKTRFVSKIVPLQPGQKIRIMSAWKHFALVEYIRYYKVLIPDLEVPADVPIYLNVKSDGIPDPITYEPINE